MVGALVPCPGMGAKGTPEPPLTLHPSSLPTELFNMVFAVLPPWGPWSDNVVPLVRLSRCLIRTANGASLTPRARPPLPAAIPQACPAAPEANKGLHSRLLASLDPKNLGQVCRSLVGECGLAQSLALSLRTSACPAWFLDHWPASREHIQAGVPCSPVVGSTEHGLEELSWHSALPRTHLSLSPQPRVAFHFIRHELLWAGGHTPSLMD